MLNKIMMIMAAAALALQHSQPRRPLRSRNRIRKK